MRRRITVCRLRVFATALAAFILFGAPIGLAKPSRIVSLNLCADQLLLLVARRENIASVTELVRDRTYSTTVYDRLARGLTMNHGQAEEIIPLKPDLVLAGRFSARSTVAILRRLGYRVVDLPVAHTVADVRRNIRLVARAVGEPARGEAVVARFDARLESLRPPVGAQRPIAAIYWLRGNTGGRGTLIDSIVTTAGFVNLARKLGLGGVASLPLEVLLSENADAILLASTAGDPPSMAVEAVTHPALARLLTKRPSVVMPPQAWFCGSPAIADAVALLAKLRQRLAKQRR